eukprot:1154821-Rhodomonas_salina.1
MRRLVPADRQSRRRSSFECCSEAARELVDLRVVLVGHARSILQSRAGDCEARRHIDSHWPGRAREPDVLDVEHAGSGCGSSLSEPAWPHPHPHPPSITSPTSNKLHPAWSH